MRPSKASSHREIRVLLDTVLREQQALITANPIKVAAWFPSDILELFDNLG